MIIRNAELRDYPAILRMNEADVELLSPMDEEKLRRASELTELFQVIEKDGKVCAFQMIYREGTDYWSDNYKWFSERYDKFLYVDRIVVHKDYRGYGLARMFYEEVFRHAKAEGVSLVTTEIDIEPVYNAPSMAFHAKMGFSQVGTKLFNDKVTVSLQVKEVTDLRKSPRNA